MLAPHIPLRFISQYEPVSYPENGTMEERKAAIRVLLNNCTITSDIGTDQMNVNGDPDLREDICNMRKAALLAIPFAESALRADTLKDFNEREREFRTQYANLISTVKSFLWDALGTNARAKTLYELSEELL